MEEDAERGQDDGEQDLQERAAPAGRHRYLRSDRNRRSLVLLRFVSVALVGRGLGDGGALVRCRHAALARLPVPVRVWAGGLLILVREIHSSHFTHTSIKFDFFFISSVPLLFPSQFSTSVESS